MARVYQWMEVPKKIANVIIELMGCWKTRLEVTEDGKVLTSKTINIRKGLQQEESYFMVGFCLAKVSVLMLIEDTDEYIMEQNEKTKKE